MPVQLGATVSEKEGAGASEGDAGHEREGARRSEGNAGHEVAQPGDAWHEVAL